MSDERRRYFRIDKTIGISYHVLEGEDVSNKPQQRVTDVLDLVSKQDKQIEKLLLEVADENPKVSALVALLNQKLERIVSQLVLESHLIGRIAHRVREANISACGVAFENDEAITVGARLKMELTLYPTEKQVIAMGIVVGCDQNGTDCWYWRIDFFGMSDPSQEKLIQHIVQAQSQQLKAKRGNV
ncbi:MAG: hypothetical protein ACI9Y1_000312 [Lentisphaeria bacterium]|jgi:hypothetical protein